jgi:hypothetical protein
MAAHGNEDIAHRGHRNYQETLAAELLTTSDDGPAQVVDTVQPGPQPASRWSQLSRVSYCKWCLMHKEDA